jgi:hypothetical protein
MKKNAYLISTIFALLLLAAAQSSQACSCMANDETVDKAFLQTPNIAVFKLQTVEKNADGGITQSKLTVEKVFKGNLKVGQELTFAQGDGANCRWTFDENSIGKEYLFYLGDKPLSRKASDYTILSTSPGEISSSQDVWTADLCSRSGNIRYGAGDIKYLEKISKVRGKTRLSGVMSKYISPLFEGDKEIYESLPGYKVTIKGNGKSIVLKTDKDGFYETYDLPAGKYTVTPGKVEGFKNSDPEEDSIEVVITAKSHTVQDFEYKISNRISGKIYGSDGKPLGNVRLHLSPARGKASQYFYEGCETEDDGSFDFDEIPAGTYVLVVNEDNKISPDAPFGTFYYPGVLKREEATEITIGAGDFRDGLVINVPQTDDTFTVSGVLSFEDGSPVVDSLVYFYEEGELKKEPVERSESSYAKTDKNGRFTIRILKGEKGMLVGLLNIESEMYENCPGVQKLIEPENIIVNFIKSPGVRIEAKKDLTGVELKFPYPGCQKAK